MSCEALTREDLELSQAHILGSNSRRKSDKEIAFIVQHGSYFAGSCKNRHQNGPGMVIWVTLTHSRRHRMSSKL